MMLLTKRRTTRFTRKSSHRPVVRQQCPRQLRLQLQPRPQNQHLRLWWRSWQSLILRPLLLHQLWLRRLPRR